MQDMIPKPGRSIRNIPMREGGRAPIPITEKLEERAPERGGRKILLLIGAVVLVACAIGGVALSTLFERTTVTLQPHMQTITLKSPLSATPAASSGSLSYETFSLVRSASTTVAVSGTKRVSRSASGVLAIYNGTNIPQQLITNTRFASPDGKIYRIKGPITIPKAITGANGSITPGSITATVYADQPGASYNLDASVKFTIPGFKGDPKYATVYAQSQGPMAGGFVGDEPAVSDSDLAVAEQSLKQTLDTTVRAAVQASIPEGFALVPGTLILSYSDVAKSVTGSSSASLAETATGKVGIIRLADLASAAASQIVSGYRGEAVLFKNPESLVLKVATSTSASNLLGPLSIMISGDVTLVWQFDQAAIKQALIGQPKTSFESIIKKFQPGVELAEAKVRPFWKSKFPSTPEKITMKVSNE